MVERNCENLSFTNDINIEVIKMEIRPESEGGWITDKRGNLSPVNGSSDLVCCLIMEPPAHQLHLLTVVGKKSEFLFFVFFSLKAFVQ